MKKKVTIDSLCKELDECIKLCKQYKQPSSMVAAIKAKAQLHGLLTEKREVTSNGNVDVNLVAKVEKPELDDRVMILIGDELGDALQ